MISTQTKVVDFGKSDKRLLAIETEFAQLLHEGEEGRKSADRPCGRCGVATLFHQGAKTNKDSVQCPHIGMIGKVRNHELKDCLGKTDMSNGFADRSPLGLLAKVPKGSVP